MTHRPKAKHHAFLLLLGVLLLLSACGKKKVFSPHFQFVPWGLEVTDVPPETPIQFYDAKGRLLLSYPAFAGEEVTLFFRWEPEARYRLVLGKRSFWLKAPKNPVVLRLQVFAPLGQRPYEFWLEKGQKDLPQKAFTLAGQTPCHEIGLLVENLAPGGLEVQFAGEQDTLKGEFARKLFTKKLCFSGDNLSKALNLTLKGPVDLKAWLRFSFHQVDLKRAIKLVSWRLPTDAFGFIEGHRLEGTLVAPNPFWQKLGYTLGIKAKGFSRYDPFAYETLRFKNRLDMPLTLLLKADFLDLKTGKPVPGFYPKRFSTHGLKQPLALLDLPPKGEAEAVLPIFLDRDIPPGEYLAQVTVYPFGSQKPLLTLKRHIGVVRGSVFLSAALLAVILWGSAYTGFIFLRLKALLSRFRLRELVLIALTGAVGFGLDFLGGLASNILYALLGPFNILIGGLVTEVAHYLVLTAVLFLVPKPGVITLGGLITYLMGGLLFGGFRITDPFFVGARLGVLEVALLLLRVYGPQGARGAQLVLALALADALNTAISLLLHMTFFRLFFPGWYIWLSVLVKGFLYTLLGAWVGLSVGKILRRVER